MVCAGSQSRQLPACPPRRRARPPALPAAILSHRLHQSRTQVCIHSLHCAAAYRPFVPARRCTRAALTFFSVAQPYYHAPRTAGRCRPTCLVPAHPALPIPRFKRQQTVRSAAPLPAHATHPCMPCHPNPCCLSLLLPYPLLALTHTHMHTHTNKAPPRPLARTATCPWPLSSQRAPVDFCVD